MDIITTLLHLLLLTGATWVLWLLIALSVISLAMIIERAFFFRGLKGDFPALTQCLERHLQAGTPDQALEEFHRSPGVEARIASAGLRAFHKGPDSAAEAMLAAKVEQRGRMEQRLAFLGTLGNNAPFIGLFGTVIGIIKAFHDLSLNTSGGAGSVMGGISEALVATAMGLFVAIPAVIAFNYFQRRIQALLGRGDGLAHTMLVHLRAEQKPPGIND